MIEEKLKQKLISNREIKPSPVPERAEEFNDCWWWTGCKCSAGYGQISLGRKHYVHRISALVYNLKDPDGKPFTLDSKYHVCHKCDNRQCTNPNHLFIGNRIINMQDMIIKGRGNNQLLTEQDVLEIRKLFNDGWTRGQLKDKFNVAYGTIVQIIANKTWSYV